MDIVTDGQWDHERSQRKWYQAAAFKLEIADRLWREICFLIKRHLLLFKLEDSRYRKRGC